MFQCVFIFKNHLYVIFVYKILLILYCQFVTDCGLLTCQFRQDDKIATLYRVAQKKVYAFDLVQRKNYKCYIAEINVAVFIKV